MQAKNPPDERPLETWEPPDEAPADGGTASPAAEAGEPVLSRAAPSPARSKGAGSPSFAQLWGAAHPQPRSFGRAIVAGGLVLMLAAVGGPLYLYLDSLDVFAVELPVLDGGPALGPHRSKQSEWLEDLLTAQDERPRHLDPVASPAPSAPQRPRPPARRSRPAGAQPAPVAQVQEQEPLRQSPYEALYGSSARYAAANSGPSARPAAAAAAAPTSASTGRGTVIYARLKDQIASHPAGGEVVATLTHRAKAGKHVLPAGTEMHGQVTGADTSRVYVQFMFARFSDGSHLALQGTARDEQGRQGIPGTQPFDKKAAGSIGLASATRGVQAAGRELAGGLGAVVGSLLEGAVDSGSSKAQRADRDESVVIAQRGATFRIYVQAVGEGAQ